MTTRFHLPQRTGARTPHRGHALDRLVRIEGAADYLTVAAIVVLAGAMIFGLLTTTGSAPWF